MKQILFYLFLLSGFCAQAQKTGYTITGKIGDYNHPSKMVIWYLQSGDKRPTTDTSDLSDGKFNFKGSVKEPVKALLILHRDITKKGSGDEFFDLFLDNADFKISSTGGMKEATATGSAVHAEYLKLSSLTKKYDDELQSLMPTYMTLSQNKSDSTKTKELVGKMRQLQNDKNELLLKFIDDNPESYMSLYALRQFAGPVIKADKVEPIFYKLSEKIRQSNGGQEMFNLIEATSKTKIGAPAPDFTQPDPDGKLISLSSFKGKYVLVDFWAAWCVPCRKENPELVKVYKEYKEKQFDVLGVSFDLNKKDWTGAIEKDKLEWTNVSELKSMHESDVAKLYGIQGVPQNFLLDPEGKIIAKNLSGEGLRKKLAEIIK